MIYILLLFILFLPVYSKTFNDCYLLFKKEEFLKSKKCFLSLEDNELLPYKNHYLFLINQIYDEDFTIKKSGYAITSYDYLKLAGDNFYKNNNQKAKKYLKSIDIYALNEEDIPFYLYIKANLYNDFSIKKELATRYVYDRNYGYKTFLEIYKYLTTVDIQKAVDILISNRMYERALDILTLLPACDKTFYYYLYLNVKLNRFEKGKKYLNLIKKNSKFYPAALYILGYYTKSWKERRNYFNLLLKTGNKKYINKLGEALIKKAFHQKKLKEFKYYINSVDKSEVKVWYSFLYKYFFKNKNSAFKYLIKSKDFIKDKNKLDYWLYLSSKDKKYLDEVRNSNQNDFYKIISDGKVSVDYQEEYCIPVKFIKKLKKIDYRWAYIEGKYFYKKTKNIQKVYCTIPEVVINQVEENKKFIKPFFEKDSLINAIMKQESLFYYKAISKSNAVGLMQFLPETAYWIAKIKKDKSFDIVKMFIPEISINYGKWYIKYLLKMFKGNIFYAIAAYNGGATNVKRILKKFRSENIAEFVETHPFDETRDYIKKVYTNYVMYKIVYGEN